MPAVTQAAQTHVLTITTPQSPPQIFYSHRDVLLLAPLDNVCTDTAPSHTMRASQLLG